MPTQQRLSDYFGKSLTGDAPLGQTSSLLAQQSGQFTPSPDTMLFEGTVPNQVALPGATQAAAGITTRNEPNTVSAPPGAVVPHGDAAAAIDNAMGYLGTDYEWGGTGADGRVDCSGLLFAAFNAAGIKMPRYRAVDYGHMGYPISTDQARPGDIVYFDNPNSDTDHVGLYLGNGQFIEAPSPGQKVRISPLRGGAQIRRILPDSSMGALQVDPEGNQVFHADNQVFTGGQAPADHPGRAVNQQPGPQADPVEQIKALSGQPSVAAVEAMGQSPGDSLLSSLNLGTPESIFTQAHPFNPFNPQPGTGAPGGMPAPAGGQGGQTVGSVGGLSSAEAWIIQHESGGDPTADNPHSTAFGIWQGLAGTRETYARQFGFSPNTTNVNEQLVMFRAYVRDRYGSAENAQKFWQEHGWY